MAHEPYIREGDACEGAVLFIHGFLGSPEHFTRFISLVPGNYAIHNILLDGHGKGVRDFARSSMEKWQKQADDAVKKLIKKYKNVIIAAHSMGTFFAMDAAVRYPDNIKAIFLLQSPLRIGVKPAAAVNTFKSFFSFTSKNDEVSTAYRNSHSVKLSKKVWLYAGWIPRYLELFRESKRSRDTILKVSVPVYINQAAKDELVSMKSMRYIPEKENISVYVMENSAHFIYKAEDYDHICNIFSKLF